MAAPDVSAVVALTNKSFDFKHAGHTARSVEYKRRALAAAEARGAADCLIVATLQLLIVEEVYAEGYEHHRRGAAGAAPPFAPALPLFFSAAAIVRRRRAAGTLLGARCTAAELTWERLRGEHIAKVQNDSVLAVTAAVMAPLIGYAAFINAANVAFYVFDRAEQSELGLTQEQLHSCVVLMADAAEMIMQPRICEQLVMFSEGRFEESMRMLVSTLVYPGFVQVFGDAGVRLLDSWRRLQQSGVLQRRGADVGIQANIDSLHATASAAAAAAAAPGLRTCALPSCDAREQHPCHFKSCAACRSPAYCCKEHQIDDWPSHKAACKAARKAAAEQKDTD
jgi:hypothetical protein